MSDTDVDTDPKTPHDPSERFETNGRQVLDEEGTVDAAVKQRLINARERVDKAEDQVFVNAETDPQLQLSREDQVIVWSTTVKQYLRSIEPLLRSDDVTAATEYYRENKIGTVRLVPPQTDGIPFDYAATTDDPPAQVRRRLGLPRGVELPDPKREPFVGLKSVIEAPKVITARWRICVDDTGPPPTHEYVTPQVRKPVPKWVYEDALRAADQFLQQAGIGLELGTPEVDEREKEPF